MIQTKKDGCFAIFHDKSKSNELLLKRSALVSLATIQLEECFTKLDTPTIIIKELEDIKKNYKNLNIKIEPRGFLNNGWKPGELGIFASNFIAWENFYKSDYKYIILLEDDVILEKDFNKKLINYMSELPDDWDLFTIHIPEYGNVRWDPNNEKLFIGKNNICKIYQNASTLCYLVSKSGAKKILEQVAITVGSPVDHYLFCQADINAYAIKPNNANICNISFMDSTIHNTEKQDMTGIF